VSDFVLLLPEVILAIHEEQLATHGGGAGLRDRGLLDSALARPQNRLAYDPGADCAALAADYAYGIARNHPFIDGNKRTAFVAMELCLALNGYSLDATDEDALLAMLALAAGETDENEFASWIRPHWTELPE
jgi:death on curing protein